MKSGQLITAHFYCIMTSMDYYKILNVSNSASKDEIKAAYRKLAAKHHPDRGGDTSKFQEIQRAYDVLMDNTKRSEYDAMNSENFSNTNFPPNMEDVLKNFGFSFGNDDQIFTQVFRRKNPDIKTSITIDLKETLSESTKFIRVKTKNDEEKTLEIKIPRGIKSNTVMKFSGGGEKIFSNMPPGDLYLTVIVLDDKKFTQRGLDLEHEIHIDCFDAILGTEIEITALSDRIFSIKIPQHTQQNTKFKIPGEGLYEFQKDIRGNLYVRINITVPQQLSESQIELVKKIKNVQ